MRLFTITDIYHMVYIYLHNIPEHNLNSDYIKMSDKDLSNLILAAGQSVSDMGMGSKVLTRPQWFCHQYHLKCQQCKPGPKYCMFMCGTCFIYYNCTKHAVCTYHRFCGYSLKSVTWCSHSQGKRAQLSEHARQQADVPCELLRDTTHQPCPEPTHTAL